MAISAALTGDPTLVYRAICHDPLTAVLSLAEIKQMTNELFAQHKDYCRSSKCTRFKHANRFDVSL